MATDQPSMPTTIGEALTLEQAYLATLGKKGPPPLHPWLEKPKEENEK